MNPSTSNNRPTILDSSTDLQIISSPIQKNQIKLEDFELLDEDHANDDGINRVLKLKFLLKCFFFSGY